MKLTKDTGKKPLARIKPLRVQEPGKARVRMRIKGSSDGPVYQGMVKVVECKTCGKAAL